MESAAATAGMRRSTAVSVTVISTTAGMAITSQARNAWPASSPSRETIARGEACSRASIGGVAGAEGEKPPSQARKGHNQNHLQRHDGVVSRLDGRQIQLERQGQQHTQNRRNPQYWKAADGEAQGQRQRQPPGRDALLWILPPFFYVIKTMAKPGNFPAKLW